MKKRLSVLGVLAVLMLLVTAFSAHALSYNSSNSIGLSAGQSYDFNFATAPGDFKSAKFSFDLEKLTNATVNIGGKSMSSPASGEFFALTGSTLTYLFTTDFHLGRNVFKLNDFLPQLNAANSANGLTLGLFMDRGSISFDNARLRGTVAPEPISMALMAAGMFGLPFARRLKKSITT